MTEKELAREFVNVSQSKPALNLVAVLPIGGAGGQMSPLTEGQPKALLPLGARPILQHIIEALPRDVFSKIYVACTTYREMVEQYCKWFGDDRVEVIHFPQNGRPAEVLRQLHSANKLSTSSDEPFLLHYGDIVLPRNTNWRDYIGALRRARSRNILVEGFLLGSVNFDYPIGVIKVQRSNTGKIEDFFEKPDVFFGDERANVAVALFAPSFMNRISTGFEDLFGEVVHSAISASPPAQFITNTESLPWLHLQRSSDWIDVQRAYWFSEAFEATDFRVKHKRKQLQELGIIPR